MQEEIFDTHAHYDDAAFAPDQDELLQMIHREGICGVTNIACDMESTETTLALAHRYDWIYGTAGVHPEYVLELTETSFARLGERAKDPRVVAVGEIGLDYYWKTMPEKPSQRYWFGRQMNLAGELGLPVVIHSRDAARDTLDVMRAHHAEDIGGVVHCFGYSREVARECVRMGFFIGIGGVVTYKNARKLKEVAADVPLTSIVLETDSPYLRAEPDRGGRNDSRTLFAVAGEIARLRQTTPEEVIRVTRDNAFRLYPRMQR